MDCSYCKTNKPIDCFTKNNKILKKCVDCRLEFEQKNRCEHNRRRSACKECDGSAFCEHNKQKIQCRQCSAYTFCEHNIKKTHCRICAPNGHLRQVITTRIRQVEGEIPHWSSCIGIDLESYRKYLSDKFTDGMSWDNYGEWHIDHIVPLAYREGGVVPTIEETIRRLHYTNTQPLWAVDNYAKGNRLIL